VNNILLLFHCKSDAGYAIDSLVASFTQMAQRLVASDKNIHVSFTALNGHSGVNNLEKYKNLVQINPFSRDSLHLEYIENYVRVHKIDVVFGFDQPVRQPSYKYFRAGGVKKIISYWGAPMSSVNTGIKLKLKQLEVLLSRDGPDHYIFESKQMAISAYKGRGVPENKVSIVYLGVDNNKFRPAKNDSYYAHDTFNIPSERKIIYYSGHMEERKGVAVLMQAARRLYEHHNRSDFHFLLLGNQAGEETPFINSLDNSGTVNHVTFGGYRNDVEKIIPSCYLGTIASTGWDSFTMSSLEMAACGLPLIVSNLQGLTETVDENKTGFLFKAGDHVELSAHIINLLSNPELRNKMSEQSVMRINSGFTKDQQINHLAETVKQVTSA
jgi:glycosyltransferase involved in cell wall biosynthesis